MSIRRKVTALVHERPGITVDGLLELLPGYTRAQLQDGLKNAAGMRLIHCKGRLRGPFPGALPAPYYPGSKDDSEMNTPLAHRVAEAIIERGEGTIDTLRSSFRHISGRDLEKALSAANALGFIRVARKSRPTVWMAGHVPMVKPPKVSSVFQLGSPLPESDWPKGWSGTTHRPLGPWHSEETDESGMAAAR